jgi:hypothetical protein
MKNVMGLEIYHVTCEAVLVVVPYCKKKVTVFLQG